MKRLLIITITTAITVVLWKAQAVHLRSFAVQNERLASVVAELESRAARAKADRKSAEERLAELRVEEMCIRDRAPLVHSLVHLAARSEQQSIR